MKIGKNISFRFLKVCLWFVYLFALLQITGFIYFRLPTVKPIGGYGYPKELFIPNPETHYAYQAGFQGYFTGGGYKNIKIHINQYGFRDREFTDKSEKKKRIIFLGDSVVFGAGISSEKRLTEKLEFNFSQKEKNIEVYNLGVNSYSYSHYVALMESGIMDELSPDILIIGVTLNDINKRAWPEEMLAQQNMPDAEKKLGGEPYDWFRETYGGQFLKALKSHLEFYRMTHDEKEAYHTQWAKNVEADWQNSEMVTEFRSNLEKSVEIVSQKNIPFIVVIFPEMNNVMNPDEFFIARNGVRKELDTLDILYCDLHDAFFDLSDVEKYFLPGDSVHFSELGHQYAADVIFQCLESNAIF